MRTRVLVVSLLIAELASVGAAQSRPDLSGTWVPIDNTTTAPPLPPSLPDGAPPPPPPPRTLSLSITQSQTQLTVDRRVEAAGQESLDSATYTFDGRETMRQMGVLAFRTRAAWDGDRLVLSSTVSHEGNAIGELKETYRLVDANLVVDSTRRSAAGTFTAHTVHARR